MNWYTFIIYMFDPNGIPIPIMIRQDHFMGRPGFGDSNSFVPSEQFVVESQPVPWVTKRSFGKL
jgi:hypothetical protein